MKINPLRRLVWFLLVNSAIASLVSMRYFEFFPKDSFTPISVIFAFTSTVGQMFILTLVFGVFLIPLVFLKRLLRYIPTAFIMASFLTLLFIDTIVFAQYRFHINAVVMELILAGDIVSFPLVTWAMAVAGFSFVFVVEFFLIKYFSEKHCKTRKKIGRKLAGVGFGLFLIANVVHTWAAANAYQPVSMITRYLPLYYPLTANILMQKLDWIDLDAVKRGEQLKLSKKSDLNYPINPIQGEPPIKPKDIMFLVIDCWRYDAFSSEIAPNIWNLSKRGVVYKNHISSGNATRAGIFGLFYGIPASYWHAFLANQRTPVLIDRLQQLNYQMGIFGSAQLTKPEFNQTVFRNIPNLRVQSKGASASERDRNLTDDWKVWYQQVDHTKPSFSFLFFDSPHGYDFPKDYPTKFQPILKELNYLSLNNDTDPNPLFNRYKTSVHYVDSLIKDVIDMLKENGKLDDTVIIVTGDHGQEFNDNKLNFWGHNSNFTDPQVKVPFIMLGPGVKENYNTSYLNSFTSHEDVAPTLLTNYLGVQNSKKDYTTGNDLFGTFVNRKWLISSKYTGYSIITSDSILEVNASGGYQMMDKHNRPNNQPLNSKQITGALEYISRFLK